jgi:hypothetical protein
VEERSPDAAEQDVEDPLPVLRRHLVERPQRAVDARVGGDDVQPTVTVLGSRDHSPDRVVVADVGHDGDGIAARIADTRGRIRGRIAPDVRDHDARSLVCVSHGGGEPDAAPTARDDRHLPAQPRHRQQLYLDAS